MARRGRTGHHALSGTDRRVERGIRLLELLSSVEGGIVTAEEARAHLSCTDAELDEALELIATLADRESGARAVVFRDHGDIVLAGEGAHLMPLRLSLGEGAALAHVMSALALDDDVRKRLSRALLPDGMREGDAPLVADTTAFGSWYPALQRAIREGRRCRIAYRAHDEREATERLVDPLTLDITDDAAYLVARNISKDAQRRYRLERIAHVTVLEEPVAPAPACAQRAGNVPDGGNTPADAIAQSLRTAPVAELRLAAGGTLPTWRGIEQVGEPDESGERRLTVRVGSSPWLFDQILAAGGSLTIVAPAELDADFLAYARSL